MSVSSPWLRTWDVSTVARVDEFLANSDNVSRRIWHTTGVIQRSYIRRWLWSGFTIVHQKTTFSAFPNGFLTSE